MWSKEIKYSREDREFMAIFEGNCIGFYSSYSAAEEALDAHVFDLLQRGLIGDAALHMA